MTRTLQGHAGWITRLRACAGGFISVGEDGRCLAWGAASFTWRWGDAVNGPIWGLGVSPDGERAFTGTAPRSWQVKDGAEADLR